MGYLRDWTGDDTASCRSLWLGKAWKVTQKIILTFSEFAQSSFLPPKGPGPGNLLEGWGRNWSETQVCQFDIFSVRVKTL